MKISGLHWAVHFCYLVVIGAVCVFGTILQKRAGQVKSDIGQVQQLAQPVVHYFNTTLNKEIERYSDAYLAGEKRRFMNSNSVALISVAAFHQRCNGIIRRLQAGTRPDKIDWQVELLAAYFQTCDSLALMCRADSAQRAGLDSIMSGGAPNSSKKQLAGLLASCDTAGAARICRNLSLRAEIALKKTLTILRNEMRVWEKPPFETVIPGIFFRECPRAGVPFEADVFLMSYSRSGQDCSVRVDGVPIPIVNGLARYERVFKRPGSYRYKVEINIRNPFTAETRCYAKDFEVYAAPVPQ